MIKTKPDLCSPFPRPLTLVKKHELECLPRRMPHAQPMGPSHTGRCCWATIFKTRVAPEAPCVLTSPPDSQQTASQTASQTERRDSRREAL